MARARAPLSDAPVRRAKRIPFEFVLDELAPLDPVTRPMFGCTAVYVGEKIVLILRDKGGDDGDDGVWVATEKAHHAALRGELPSLRSIGVLGAGVTSWQCIPKEHPRFEEDALWACASILAGDERIGRVPATRRKKAAGGGARKSR